MFQIFNIKERLEFLEEVAVLIQKEWGDNCKTVMEFNKKVQNKITKIRDNLDRNDYCTLVLVDGNTLIGFISIFPHDCDEQEKLTPWYATMYVKKEYRGKGYSKILNDAILKEARTRGYSKIYLKTELNNYYEKFGAKFKQYLSTGEKIMYFEL